VGADVVVSRWSRRCDARRGSDQGAERVRGCVCFDELLVVLPCRMPGPPVFVLMWGCDAMLVMIMSMLLR
jgi:hypothetical protein